MQEGLAAGMPVLVSDRVGAARDLLDHEKAGWTFDPDEPDALTRELPRLLAADHLMSESAREARRQHVRQWSSETLAGCFSAYLLNDKGVQKALQAR